ncbi:hypothetical protein DWG18_14045 [Lysobacter sp. TY2-98]|uniref:hypothetical protein n=1 Tax=Lysobacter sp. TY2-98 TaxID=2290922 RepID=UPI000E204153|nr:hypothetical protein [Lysobacter sp. TY2-98]AXK73289.1 hypothetical protein DWG18_14045 [Lysobacter sp. TY2-98]
MTTWPGWSNDNTLLLPLADAPPTKGFDFDGRHFDAKKELHVTLVGRALGAELRRAFGERLDVATRPAFEALDWSCERTGQHRLIERADTGGDGERGTVASVIELVHLPALDWYYRWLGDLVGRQLAVPPAHVTLYTHGKTRGIGIPTARSLRAWSRGAVPIPA